MNQKSSTESGIPGCQLFSDSPAHSNRRCPPPTFFWQKLKSYSSCKKSQIKMELVAIIT